jgi:hypothetical protein
MIGRKAKIAAPDRKRNDEWFYFGEARQIGGNHAGLTRKIAKPTGIGHRKTLWNCTFKSL